MSELSKESYSQHCLESDYRLLSFWADTSFSNPKSKEERKYISNNVLHHPQSERPMYTTSQGKKENLSKCDVMYHIARSQGARERTGCMDLKSIVQKGTRTHGIIGSGLEKDGE